MSLNEQRQKMGWTLKKLSAKSGVHYMKIHQIEHGKIKPENMALKTALKLSKALDCKPEDLIRFDCNMPTIRSAKLLKLCVKRRHTNNEKHGIIIYVSE